jgi:hypothetical protein
MFVIQIKCYIFVSNKKHMKLLEFEIVVYLKDGAGYKEEEERLQFLGIKKKEEEIKVDKIVNYAFCPDKIIEVRDTFVTYNETWEKAIVCVYISGKYNYETPPLLTTYEEFKTKLDEYYKEKSKVE